MVKLPFLDGHDCHRHPTETEKVRGRFGVQMVEFNWA